MSAPEILHGVLFGVFIRILGSLRVRNATGAILLRDPVPPGSKCKTNELLDEFP